MNYTIVKIAARDATDDDEEYIHQAHIPSHFVKTEAFTVLPPLSPKIPGPPPTPSPYRILPPIVSRKRPSFVIIQELGSRPQSREPSPSGRVSPFRGCGFKPSATSREPSFCGQDEDSSPDKTADKRESRSRLPVASKKATHRVSKSASPAPLKNSGIPVPLNRRISYSPKRTEETLRRMNQKLPLKSSENLLTQRPAVSESDLKSALNKPNTNRQSTPRKAPIPRQPKPAAKSSTPRSPSTKLPAAKDTRKVPPASSNRRNLYLGKNEALKKNAETAGKVGTKTSPSRPKTLPKLQSKVASAKSKENLSPCSNPPTMKVAKAPSTGSKTLKKDAVKTSALEKVKEVATTKPDDCGTHCNTEGEPSTTATPSVVPETPTVASPTLASSVETTGTSSVSPSTPNAQTSDPEKSKPLKAMVKRVGRKALTTGNLIAALKKTTNEAKSKTEDGEAKVEDKKDLPHMDTTRSLPISIATTNLTDSSVTLIRTTTEPALAPVEPELITEIRSALIDAKNATDEGIRTQKEIKDAAAEAVGEVSAVVTNSPAEVEAEVLEEVIRQVDGAKAMVQPTEEVPSKGSPRPVHVIAVTKIEEPKQEITSTVVEIKQEADSEVQSVNASNQSENRNGISKSSWLNEKPEAIMRKSSVRKLTENPSTESLVPGASKSKGWHRFRSKCPKCFRRAAAPPPVSISTIAKTAAEEMADSKGSKGSCMREYLLCVHCRCKKPSTGPADPQQRGRPQWRCLQLKPTFRRVFDRWRCCQRHKVSSKFAAASVADTEVACVGPPMEQPKAGVCSRCSGSVLKCLGLLCCVQSAFCVRMRAKCGSWCSCCKKCICCGDRKKRVISEAERRRSTISMPRKRRWTRYFTDFPKLDASFVEHGSVMRGAIPVLPVPLAWICLILNVFLPGFGTLSSGIFCLFVGKPRFSINDSIFARIGAFVVNLLVASSQLFTVLFCLVGWGWSIWWGVMMLKMSKKNKRIILAEQGTTATHLSPVAPNKNRDVEKGPASNG